MMLVAWSLFLRRAPSFESDGLGMSVLHDLPGIHGHTRSFSGQTAANFSRIIDSGCVLIGTFTDQGTVPEMKNAGTFGAAFTASSKVPAWFFLQNADRIQVTGPRTNYFTW
jgi:hypothetical protein